MKFGNLKICLKGSSHGKYVGCTVKGFPTNTKIDLKKISESMELRKPSKKIGTERTEKDEVEFYAGVENGVITEKKIEIRIKNHNVRKDDYSAIKNKPRPGHADYPEMSKNPDYDPFGNNLHSGRMTAPIVAAGAIASQILEKDGIKICAFAKKIYDVEDKKERSFAEIQKSKKFQTRAADKTIDAKMKKAIIKASSEGDSAGGIVECMIANLPPGIGGAWEESLDSALAGAMLSIPGAKGIEFGNGFGLAEMKGSKSNDQYFFENRKVICKTNNLGGICGGMSNGMPLVFRVAFKPTPSISKTQKTVDMKNKTNAVISVPGRHDPCIVPRAVSVVESLSALVICGLCGKK